jgi:polyisoprenoid-binding protein YceI
LSALHDRRAPCSGSPEDDDRWIIGDHRRFDTVNDQKLAIRGIEPKEFHPMSKDTVPLAGGLATGTWRLDPARSSVEFHVRHFYGLMTVKGRFDRYQGTLDLSASPPVELTIEADSLGTKQKQRDKHLRSEDFFDVANHPQVRFEADDATVDGNTLKARGRLYAAGKQVALDVDATVTPVDGEFEVEATVPVDQRELGMTWSPLGITRAPSKLVVRGRLVRTEDQR